MVRPSSDAAADADALSFHSDVESRLGDVRQLIRHNQLRVREQLEANLRLSEVDVESVEDGSHGDDYYYYDDEDSGGSGVMDYYEDDYEEDLLRPLTDGGRRAQGSRFQVGRVGGWRVEGEHTGREIDTPDDRPTWLCMIQRSSLSHNLYVVGLHT